MINQAIIYIRVSSKKQIDTNDINRGWSFDVQEKICRDYCNEHNFTITSIIREICSARIMNKQHDLNDIIETNENINLIIMEPSRLSRNIKDFIILNDMCKKKNIIIHFAFNNLITSSSIDMKNIISIIYDAEIESNKTSERIKRTYHYKKLAKLYQPSVIHYGYKYIKNPNKYLKDIVKDDEEQLIIELINKLYYGENIGVICNLLKQITGEEHILYNPKKPDEERINELEYGNLTKTNIVNFLNSIPILRRGKEWNITSVSKLIDKFTQ